MGMAFPRRSLTSGITEMTPDMGALGAAASGGAGREWHTGSSPESMCRSSTPAFPCGWVVIFQTEVMLRSADGHTPVQR